jgi:ribonuclease HI
MTSAEDVAERELSLLNPAVRGDRAQLEALLHPDFVEVGASGRRWTRSQIIDALVDAPSVDDLQVSDLQSRALDTDVVLVTYSVRRAGTTTLRSSIWVRRELGWVVRFHQGTPMDRPERSQPRPGPGA